MTNGHANGTDTDTDIISHLLASCTVLFGFSPLSGVVFTRVFVFVCCCLFSSFCAPGCRIQHSRKFRVSPVVADDHFVFVQALHKYDIVDFGRA